MKIKALSAHFCMLQYSLLLFSGMAGAQPAPAHKPLGVQRRSIPVLYGENGAAVITATLNIVSYPQDTTFLKMNGELATEGASGERSTPEGLECLAAEFRTNPNPTDEEIKQYLDLWLAEVRPAIAQSIARDPPGSALPALRPLHKAVFGSITEFSIASAVQSPTNPFANGPFTDLMVDEGGKYVFSDPDPRGKAFAAQVFVVLTSQYENSSGYLNHDYESDTAFRTLSFRTPMDKAPTPSPVTEGNDASGLSISVLLAPLDDGSYFDFLKHVILTMADGNDDQIRRLFDKQGPQEVDQLFNTINDRAFLQQYRREFRSGKLGKAFLIHGRDVQYILFELKGFGDPSSAPADILAPSTRSSSGHNIYIMRCSQLSGTISLTASINQEVTQSAEEILGNDVPDALMTPSVMCEKLLDGASGNK